MAYIVHNFEQGDILYANQLNEMDAQIAENEESIENSASFLGTHKVAQPLDENYQPTNGTDGQLLRTNGDGTTKWVNTGLPTDAQTAEAVSAWLNDHPEATTTVQDWSLSYKKLVKGTLGFVMPEMFGAKGDGIQDDTTAVQYAVDTGLPVRMNGTYKLTGSIIGVSSLYGMGTVIAPSADYLFDGTNIIIIGISIDGNDSCKTLIRNHGISSVWLNEITVYGFSSTFSESGFPYDSAVYVNADRAIIENIIVKENAGHGCRICPVNNGFCIISGSVFANNGNDTEIDGGGLVCYGTYEVDFSCSIIGCEAYQNGRSGFAIHAIPNVICSNCYSHDNGEHGFVLMNGHGGTIANCKSARNASFAICVQGDTSVEGSKYTDFTITGCSSYNERFLRLIYNVSRGIVEDNMLTLYNDDPSIAVRNFVRFYLADTEQVQETEFSISSIIFKGNSFYCPSNNEYRMFWVDGTSELENVTLDNNNANGKSWNSLSYQSDNFGAMILQPSDCNDISGNVLYSPTDFSKWRMFGNGYVINKNTLYCNSLPIVGGYDGCVYQMIEYKGSKYLSVSVTSEDESASIAIRLRNSVGSLLTRNMYRCPKYTKNSIFVFDIEDITKRLEVSLADVCFIDIIATIAPYTEAQQKSSVTVYGIYARYSDSGIGYATKTTNRATPTTYDDAGQNAIDMIFGIPLKVIPETSPYQDLDNYLSPGSYRRAANVNVNNSPTTDAFRLDVIGGQSNSTKLQILRRQGTRTVQIWARSYLNNGTGTLWGEWYQFNLTQAT